MRAQRGPRRPCLRSTTKHTKSSELERTSTRRIPVAAEPRRPRCSVKGHAAHTTGLDKRIEVGASNADASANPQARSDPASIHYLDFRDMPIRLAKDGAGSGTVAVGVRIIRALSRTGRACPGLLDLDQTSGPNAAGAVTLLLRVVVEATRVLAASGWRACTYQRERASVVSVVGAASGPPLV